MKRFMVVCAALVLSATAAACGPDQDVAKFKQYLEAADQAGYSGEGTLEVDLDPAVYAQQKFGLGGRASLRLQIRKTKDSAFVGPIEEPPAETPSDGQ